MTRITIDPSELQPGDLVLGIDPYDIGDRELHISVTVDRAEDDPWQVIDNITGQPVRSGMSGANATGLCRGLNLQAGPGGRYGARPGVLTPVTGEETGS